MTERTDGGSRWIEIVVAVPAGREDEAGEALCVEPITGVLVEDGRVVGHARAEAWTEAERAALDRRLAALAPPLTATCSPVTFPDSALDWRARWRPFRVGRCAIGAAESLVRLRPADVALALVPGGAFGTGRHGSTRAALAFLQDVVSRGARVLDAGAGSGILAVVALRFGASRALAFDVDPNSASCAAELARDNGVCDRLEFRTGGFEVLTDADRGFDVVLANLYADLLRSRAADLVGRVAPGGAIVLAGLRAWEADAIEAIYRALGVGIVRRRIRGRWAALVGRRGETRPE